VVDLKCFGTSGHVVRRAASLHHRSDGGDAGDGAVFFFFFAQQPAIATPTKRGKSSPTTVTSGQFYLDLFGLSLLNFQGYLQNCGDK